MTARVPHGASVGILALCVACSNANRSTAPSQLPTASTQTSPSPVVEPLVFPPLVVPPLSGPANTYTFSGQLEYRVSHFTVTSRYVLYENGAFVLQYLSGELAGAYQRENGRINFRFADDDYASGILDGDVLEVRYSDRMQHSDFENAVYRRSQ